ncbi:hypothetical protein [Variovorax ginsengisoli]|uniref:PABS domain-containing protein n=1 Tax=Variovorax ginsengisoli TaxID=363844 RepID=A0ABT8SG91_9BURK|nr:hypothetical protein [Variovorax ginsengisoli]MDN8618769.1 hypothetical protein [Variovorax ginsengisoli]MDO1537939.1 hypothetical protein [Variovorax ginsengisoli]
MASFAWLLSLAVGFLSLSQEILWVRLISFGLRGMSQSFAIVLLCFLVGIAIGSAIGKRFCERHDDLLRTSALVLAAAAVIDLSLLRLLPALLQGSASGLAAVLFLIVLAAALKSIMFPIAHHLGSQQSGTHIGRSVSKVYFGNIIGSTLGPIVTGYVLLDRLSIDGCLLLIGLATGVLSLLCAAQARKPATGLAAMGAIIAATALAWSGPAVVPAIALATSTEHVEGTKVDHVVQNRQGIIHTLSTPDGKPDVILGGNAYDGQLNVDMRLNGNLLDRGLALLAVHPNPERVLVIGMSTGAWARILSASPRIKEMTVVEINPGYLKVIAQYPQVAGLLKEPRIQIVIDDGRRWLRRNPDQAFDLVVQNTTWSWRGYSTNLLSLEYMQLVSSHLKPGGIFAMNSTGSSDVLHTAHKVFPFVERRLNFVYGSKSDFSRPVPTAEAAFRELRLDNSVVFAEQAFRAGGLAREMIKAPFVAPEQQFAGMSESPGLITDQNMLVEHAHGLWRYRLPNFYRKVDHARMLLDR